jgi:hypothetical protein
MQPLGCVADAVSVPTGAVAAKVAGSVVQDFADACARGADWAVHTLMTAWLAVPPPDVNSEKSPARWLNDRLGWLVAAVMLGSVCVAAGRLALTRRHDHTRDLAQALVRTVAVTAAAGMVIASLVSLSDAFASWILDQSKVDLSRSVVFEGLASQPMIVIVLGLTVILTQLLQFGLMLARNAMIILLAGTLPVAAAASGTATGRAWWSRSVAWLVAFILYKPAAALVYATAFRMVGADQSVTGQISGALLMILAVLALPALLKLTVPATAAMATGNSGATAAVMVGGAIATGATLATGGAAAGGFLSSRGPTGNPMNPASRGSSGGGANATTALRGVQHVRTGVRATGNLVGES